MQPEAILAIDVGGGTQDILFWSPENCIENCVKLVLPSPTRIQAGHIRRVTGAGRSLFLDGMTMGGGAVTKALKEHLAAGLEVFATPPAATTFHDNLDYVVDMGVQITETAPEHAVRLRLGDLDLQALARAVEHFDIVLPPRLAVAVQDHGHVRGRSNRITRFELWRRFLNREGNLSDLAYCEPPRQNSRMRAIHELRPDALIMDTGPAAILGALLDGWAAEKASSGLLVVNVGNEHTLGALVRGKRVFGIYEHHTSCLDRNKLLNHLERFRRGELCFEEVFQDMGHGTAMAARLDGDFRQAPLLVTGPQRRLLRNDDGRMAAPLGDMMLSGCFGLVSGALDKWYPGYSFSCNPADH